MKHLIAVLASAIVLAGCGVADLSSDVEELNNTGDQLTSAVEQAGAAIQAASQTSQ